MQSCKALDVRNAQGNGRHAGNIVCRDLDGAGGSDRRAGFYRAKCVDVLVARIIRNVEAILSVGVNDKMYWRR